MTDYEIWSLGLQGATFLAAASAVFVAQRTLRETHERERKQETMEYVQDKLVPLYLSYAKAVHEIIDERFVWSEIKKDDEKRGKVYKFLNGLEYLSVGISEKVYDISVLNNTSGTDIINSYDKLKRIVEDIRKERPKTSRKQNEKITLYENFIELGEKLKKLRGL